MRKVCNGGSGAAVASQRNGDAAEGDSDLPLVVVKRELAKDSDGSSVARFCRMTAATTKRGCLLKWFSYVCRVPVLLELSHQLAVLLKDFTVAISTMHLKGADSC